MNIRVNWDLPIRDGTEIVFRSPADCSQVTGLKVYYPGDDGTTATEFAFADAHGNNVGDIPHLFAEGVAVKVILDVTKGRAYVQNADTNKYIESTFVKSVNGKTPDANGNVAVAQANAAPKGFGLGEDSGKACADYNTATLGGFYAAPGTGSTNAPTELSNFKFGTLTVEPRLKNRVHQRATYDTYGARRVSTNGGSSWSAWEYENPPMVYGVEYRTIERHNGKPVWAILFSAAVGEDGFGAEIVHNVTQIVDCRCVLYEEPVVYTNYEHNLSLENGTVCFTIMDCPLGTTVEVLLKYTK